ncbi:unnamed protein product [Angiostrongylus costaricensis]|uniref:UDP-N-acetylglucosamine transporter n=1 Tax=Angiostrongylus costaricensis TaxID=334426 RepID=A0A0R3PLS5_ANGCS|nr:unnamed protein product [Angiostrongylus costaricensis]
MTALVTGKNLKYVSLVVLIAQTTALVLILRYSKTQKIDGPRYISSTAIILSEIVKMVTCLAVIFHTNGWRFSSFQNEIFAEIIEKRSETLKVTYQLKILSTAFFSVTMLGRSLNRLKWIALVLLTGGVALVQVRWIFALHKFRVIKPGAPVKASGDRSGSIAGLFAVLAACLSSGFAGVYFEKILKTTNVSLWMRNLQLAFFSIFGGFLMCWLYDWKAIQKDGFLQGYNFITWVVIMLQAYGGLIIALVVKYADNILKGFAVSLSIILSSLISWLFLADFEPSL